MSEVMKGVFSERSNSSELSASNFHSFCTKHILQCTFLLHLPWAANSETSWRLQTTRFTHSHLRDSVLKAWFWFKGPWSLGPPCICHCFCWKKTRHRTPIPHLRALLLKHPGLPPDDSSPLDSFQEAHRLQRIRHKSGMFSWHQF